MSNKLRQIPGYEGLYSITSTGRVFRHSRRAKHNSPNRHQQLKSKWLKALYNKFTSYNSVLLYDGKGSHKYLYIHRLVLIAWGPPQPSKEHNQANHKDCNKTNNDISNLEWITPKGNRRHAIANGHAPKGTESIGIANGRSKLTESDVINIRKSKNGPKQLSKKFGVSRQVIWNIKKRHIWKHI